MNEAANVGVVENLRDHVKSGHNRDKHEFLPLPTTNLLVAQNGIPLATGKMNTTFG